ncbi:pentapeptide repeat-containing protein, partial [Planktothrix sp. FACHB-1355]
MQRKIFAIAILILPFCWTAPSQAAKPEHIKQLLATNQCPKCDLKNVDLRGGNFRGADLTGANLAGAMLEGADLRGAKLRGAELQQTVLRSANLEVT